MGNQFATFFCCHILHTCQTNYIQQKHLNPIHFQWSTKNLFINIIALIYMCIYVHIQHPHGNKKIGLHPFVHGEKLDLKTTSWSLREQTFTIQKQIKLKKKVQHWKGIENFPKLKAMMVRTSKNKWKRFKKRLIIMEKKLWISKTQLYGK